MFFLRSSGDPTIVRMLRSTLVIVCAIVLGILISTFAVGISMERRKFPSLLGNRPGNIEYVQSHTDPNNFSFIAMGDVKDGTSTFEALLDIAELEKPSFIVILGDMVGHLNKIDHELFVNETSEYASKIPFVVIPGNHDIRLEGGFTIDDFEHIYGPAQFSFTIGSNLFIFLNDLPEYNLHGEYLDFLESSLLSNNHVRKKTFVFMHAPPSNLSSSINYSGAPYSDRFTDIVKKYHIDYILASHHHGYIKTEKDNAVYIISGGGGATLEGSKGRFHHLVEINVQNGNIFDNVIATERKFDGIELLERNIILYLWGPIRQNKLISEMSILYSLAAGFTLLLFLKKRVLRENGS